MGFLIAIKKWITWFGLLWHLSHMDKGCAVACTIPLLIRVAE